MAIIISVKFKVTQSSSSKRTNLHCDYDSIIFGSYNPKTQNISSKVVKSSLTICLAWDETLKTCLQDSRTCTTRSKVAQHIVLWNLEYLNLPWLHFQQASFGQMYSFDTRRMSWRRTRTHLSSPTDKLKLVPSWSQSANNSHLQSANNSHLLLSHSMVACLSYTTYKCKCDEFKEGGMMHHTGLACLCWFLYRIGASFKVHSILMV